MNKRPTLEPQDAHNQQVLDQCWPEGRQNPEPKGVYNLLVVGGGPAGLVAAAGAAGLGARVALVEKHLMGGDCLNTGCVPSKALLHSARVLAWAAEARELGMQVPPPSPEYFTNAMERLRKVRAEISAHDAVRRFEEMGIDVYLGEGAFTGRDRFMVDGRNIRFARAAVCTGGRARVPEIEGVEEAGCLTNENVFELTTRPARMVIIGAGPIGCELAQAFARFGTKVTVLQPLEHLLPREEPEAASILRAAFEREGIEVWTRTKTLSVSREGMLRKVVIEREGQQEVLETDAVLLATGRQPNVENLGLGTAGVEFARHGIKVDDHLRTSNPRIFAAGDVCMRHKFTHAADAAARIVLQNALFPGRGKLSALTIPWATYTSPEIAHVGLYPHEAAESGIEYDTYRIDLSENDRAICEGETEGYVSVVTAKGGDRILGATIVNEHAGELIGEVCVAMKAGVGLGTLGNVIHPYPTRSEALKHAGDALNRTHLKPWVARLMRWWFAWRR